MTGAKRDDLMLVNRDGKDYQSTVASINLPISEHPELPDDVGYVAMRREDIDLREMEKLDAEIKSQ